MKEIPVRISKTQALKLKRGKPVQFAHSQLSGDANIKLVLNDDNAKKVLKAVRNKKGCRLLLSPEEIHGSGIFDWLKDAGKWLKKNIVDTEFYQKNIRPVARDIVKTGVSMLPVPQVGRDITQKGAEFLGEKTGAFGMMGRGIQYPTPRQGLQGGGSSKCKVCKCPMCGGSFRLN